MSPSPEIGRSILAGGVAVNYHDYGHGDPVILIHGSGPGVTAWANWRLTIPDLSRRVRTIAPDMLGFGYSERPGSGQMVCDKSIWVAQLAALMDALDIDRAHIIGNSFGGAIALAMAIAHPDRVGKLVLMGAAGTAFPITDGLDRIWGYDPSFQAMREMMDLFAYDRTLVTDELAELRYQASLRPGVQEAFAALFPAPRQRWVDALASDPAAIKALPHETLIIHGRDDRIIPLSSSLNLHQWIDRSQLHVFGRCGHWTQIEQAAGFTRLVGDFLAGV